MHRVEAGRGRLAGVWGWRLALVVGAVLALLSAPRWAQAASDGTANTVVCASCEVDSISAALAAAQPGDRIEVRGGVYPGDLVIDRPVSLVGVGRPVIAGSGSGTVIHVAAPDVSIEGFVVRSSGSSLDHEDAGILIEAPRATVADTVVEDSLFGIYLKKAHGSVIRGNTVTAKPVATPLRGDGLRIWYSDDVLVEHNVARDGRDVILWYSKRGRVVGNSFDRGRYGLHLMFSDDAWIEGNSLRDNSIGIYIMYSRNATVIGNWMSDNHGPSGAGMGLKDVDGLLVEGNRFVNNRIGVQVDNSPREPNIEHLFRGNIFSFNGIGLGLLPNVRNNTLTENSFQDNVEAVAVLGGGTLQRMTWAKDGRGNYWSDYAGYDADRDGIGDIPYHSQRLFEWLMDRHPELRLFLFSPAAMAVDFASRAFPSVRPDIKLEDSAPLTRPEISAALPAPATMSALSRALTGGVAALAVLAAVLALRMMRLNPRRTLHTAAAGPGVVATTVPRHTTLNGHVPVESAPVPSRAVDAPPLITVTGLSKRYGRTAALSDVAFHVRAGEAVSLWGPNGAGKTTILRCLLGVVRYSGEVRVQGLDPTREGRAIRRTIGYVPQELAAPAMTVGEMVDFIAALKRVPEAQARERLELLHIADQADKPVGALSGGLKQRLALALALIGSPSLLLLDEPTANLDARGRAELLELLKRLKRDEGLTLIFSSHRPEDVLTLADRILILDRGVPQGEATPVRFLEQLGAEAHMVLYVDEGQVKAALAEVSRLGYGARADGSTISLTLPVHQKANVIYALTRSGVVVRDFEVERGRWTG